MKYQTKDNKMKKKWKPELEEKYYFITDYMNVNYAVHLYWFSEARVKVGNCFKTKKEAQAKLKRIKEILNKG